MQALLGLGVLIGIAWLLSEDRKGISWRLVVIGLALQLGLALLILYLPLVREGILMLNVLVQTLERATFEATSFVFGYLGGAEPPFVVARENAMYLFAFRVIPLILVFSVLVALGWYWRILPLMVRGVGKMLERTMGVGGGVGLGAGASIFIGMVEAPMTVRPLLARFDRGELFVLMTCGMATVAGTVMVLYATILEPVVPGALGHILAASVISAPAAILIGQIMVPMGQDTAGSHFDEPPRYGSTMDAITQGTQDGIRLCVSVLAMLLVLLALVALVNSGLDLLPAVAGEPLTLQRILGWLFAPLAWLIGVPWSEAMTAGSLLGTKLVLNELIAYLDMAALGTEALSEQSRLILLYAMCGFANLSSLGIMIGGLVTMCPERRDDLLSLAPRTLISGTLATFMTGALIGLLS